MADTSWSRAIADILGHPAASVREIGWQRLPSVWVVRIRRPFHQEVDTGVVQWVKPKPLVEAERRVEFF